MADAWTVMLTGALSGFGSAFGSFIASKIALAHLEKSLLARLERRKRK